MDKQQTTKPSVVKKFQQRNLLLLIAGIVIVLFAFYCFVDNGHSEIKTPPKLDKADFATPLNHVDAQSVWIERAQNQLAEQNKTTSALKQQLQFLQQQKDSQDKQGTERAQTLQLLQNKVDALQRQLDNKISAKKNLSNTKQSGELFPAAPGSENNNPESIDGNDFISDVKLQLAPRKLSADEIVFSKNPDTFVPSGTHVSAIVLQGADAPASVSSQGNPTPMILHLIDEGTLPNNRKSHLKGCRATAAVVGDISSERGEVRLERLSCTKPNGQIIEIPVEATVAGSDGKNGIRGIPVWREGALLQRAFAAGTLSGISKGISQSYTANAMTPLGSAVQTIDANKILQYGLANGASNAAEKLAEYNIKRAEQYHPVIQLSAGTTVDIIFLKGFYLDGKKHTDDEQDLLAPTTPMEATSAVTTTATTTNPLSNNGTSPLPLTPTQIERLKQKNAQLGYD